MTTSHTVVQVLQLVREYIEADIVLDLVQVVLEQHQKDQQTVNHSVQDTMLVVVNGNIAQVQLVHMIRHYVQYRVLMTTSHTVVHVLQLVPVYLETVSVLYLVEMIATAHLKETLHQEVVLQIAPVIILVVEVGNIAQVQLVQQIHLYALYIA